jgi:signal transduction histidine kinase
MTTDMSWPPVKQVNNLQAKLFHAALLVGAGMFFLLIGNAFANGKENVSLTQSQLDWLKDHPVVRVAYDPAFPPVEFTAEGNIYKGMAADYLEIISTVLEIQFEIVHPQTWEDALDLIRERKVDILSAVAKTSQREDYMVFTKPYLNLPAVVITARTDVDDWSMENLLQMKIAVVSDYAWDDWIMESYPEALLIRTPNIVSGLETVSFGAADAMIGDLATTSFFIGQSGITNLRVARQIDQSLDLSIGVRSDMAILRDIFDRVLEAISEERREAIKSGWIQLESPAWWKNPVFLWWASGITLLFVVIILAVSILNRTLQHRVEVRTRQLKDTQARLLQAAKLESVGRLAAGVAHEVKNPLAILQMGLDFVRPDVETKEPCRETIDDMQNAIDRASSIIQGLLDFSREEKLVLEPVDLNQVIQRSLQLVKHELSRQGVEARTELADSLPKIDGDSDKLQQVFINLFMNALHAIKGKGVLTVSSSVEPGKSLPTSSATDQPAFPGGDKVIVIQVMDSGPGIPEDKLDKLFDPFFTTKPVGEGTGLGLSITHNIVELHHGLIRFSNRPEGGACATLVFYLSR